jgi:hypothetical protein
MHNLTVIWIEAYLKGRKAGVVANCDNPLESLADEHNLWAKIIYLRKRLSCFHFKITCDFRILVKMNF